MPSLDSRPDLVLIMTDQQRHDQVGYASGGAIRTPHLDRLAASGVVFENAYSGSTTCVPARTSLLTGLLDHRVPHTDKVTIETGTWTLPHALAQVGYQTALVGKMHFNPIRADHGFQHMRTCEHLGAYPDLQPSELAEYDHYHDYLHELGLPDWRFELPGGVAEGNKRAYRYEASTHPTSWVRDETLRYLSERDPERPLFLVVSFPHPHPVINPPEPYASMYGPEDCFIDPDGAAVNDHLPDYFREETAQADFPNRRVHPERLAAHRKELALTYGLVSQIDDAVGRVVDEIDLDRTLLHFTSDHGDYAGHRGLVRKVPWIPFDDLAKVPCFTTGAMVAGSSRRIVEPMQSFDFAVTCMEIAGLDLDRDVFDGRSLLPMLLDPSGTGDPDRPVYSGFSVGWPMVRRGRHKYIRHSGWGVDALFDVISDPEESRDITSLDEGGEVKASLMAEFERVWALDVPDLPTFGPAPG